MTLNRFGFSKSPTFSTSHSEMKPSDNLKHVNLTFFFTKTPPSTEDYITERGSFMDEKLKRIEAELKKLGINTVDDLNRAIKNQEKLDLSLMVSQLPKKEKIAG